MSVSFYKMIKTERFLLRAHRVEDFDRYLPLWVQSEIPPGTPGALTLSGEESWARLLRFIGHWSHFGYGFFIVEDLASGQLVAEAGFAHFNRNVDPRMEGVPEAGWRVLRDRRKEGVASEVMQAAVTWLDARIAPQRTVCMIHPDNISSIKVASRLGYIEFGRSAYRNEAAILMERIPVSHK